MTQTQVHRIEIAAPAERIWAAITEPEFTVRYFFGSRVELGRGPGARMRFLSPDGELWGDGTVLESRPPHLLVVEWRSLYLPEAHAEPSSRVSWRIEPTGEGSCTLTVTHDRLADSPRTARSVGAPEGWPAVLDGLRSLLEGAPTR